MKVNITCPLLKPHSLSGQGQFSSCPPSIRWTAPEVLRNPLTHETDSDSPLTVYSDVYSFGICMWELASGQDPFSDHNEQEVGTQIGSYKQEVPKGVLDFNFIW